MKFRTELKCEAATTPVIHPGPLLSLGSCFAENIAGYLMPLKYDVASNPCGVLYNPASILAVLQCANGLDDFSEKLLVQNNGLWHSLLHSSHFSAPEKQSCHKNALDALRRTEAYSHKARHAIITYGTAWVYEHRELKRIVANCHKLPAEHFIRRRLTVEEVAAITEDIIGVLRRENPELHIIFTLSPVRHLKDGFHGNQLSKATLLLGLDKALAGKNNTDYFPAYEMLLDDLRDYRFFAEDLTHPAPAAIAYVREKFKQSYLYRDAELIKNIEEIQNALTHRPIHPGSTAHQRFVQSVLEKINTLGTRYPYLDFSAEKKQLSA